MVFCARATRGLRRPSLDAPSGRSISPIPKEITSELGRVIDLKDALPTRSQKDEEGAARCPLCSQNAHDQNVLVRCAQLRATLATPLKNDEESSKAYAQRAASEGMGQGVCR